jgi:hypothetical protein
MGSRSQTYATVRAALELIADGRLAAATNVTEPDRYRARILDELRQTHHHRALEVLEAHPGTDAEILALVLDPPSPARVEPHNPSAALPLVTPEWPATDPTGLDADHARERITGIRESLGAAAQHTVGARPEHVDRFRQLTAELPIEAIAGLLEQMSDLADCAAQDTAR